MPAEIGKKYRNINSGELTTVRDREHIPEAEGHVYSADNLPHSGYVVIYDGPGGRCEEGMFLRLWKRERS